jgi:hypothetical protein
VNFQKLFDPTCLSAEEWKECRRLELRHVEVAAMRAKYSPDEATRAWKESRSAAAHSGTETNAVAWARAGSKQDLVKEFRRTSRTLHLSLENLALEIGKVVAPIYSRLTNAAEAILNLEIKRQKAFLASVGLEFVEPLALGEFRRSIAILRLNEPVIAHPGATMRPSGILQLFLAPALFCTGEPVSAPATTLTPEPTPEPRPTPEPAKKRK